MIKVSIAISITLVNKERLDDHNNYVNIKHITVVYGKGYARFVYVCFVDKIR